MRHHEAVLEGDWTRAKEALVINEIYLAVCGEGREIGLPATFVRTSGCNLRCPGWPCDTPYTSVKPEGSRMAVGEVAARVAEIGCPRVFLTGGEPLLWHRPLKSLIGRLRETCDMIMLQSNGTIYAEEVFALCDQVSLDCKTPSSLESSDFDVIRRAVAEAPQPQVKFVIRDETDYAFALRTYERLAEDIPSSALSRCAFVLQPMDAVGREDRDTLLTRLLWLQEAVQERGHWFFRPLPQLHVLLYGAEKRGV